jgi:signal peptidase I
MAPTIRAHDDVMVDMREVKPQAGQLIAFSHFSVVLMRRVIGMPGNEVLGKNGSVFVNGTELNEPYVQHIGPRLPNMDNFGPRDVPQGQLFLMGDNRDIALDSRMQDYGDVPVEAIIGKPLYLIPPGSGFRAGKTLH